MTLSMVLDLYKWLFLLSSIVLGFAAALFINSTVRPEVPCADSAHFNFIDWVYALFSINLGGGTLQSCHAQVGDNVSLTLLQLYYLIALILLMNMLIASAPRHGRTSAGTHHATESHVRAVLPREQ